MTERWTRRVATAGGALGLLAAIGLSGPVASAATTLQVGCGSGTYTSIGAAIAAAAAGDTISVCAGTYTGPVVVTKPLTITGQGHPLINATGQDTGVTVVASGSTIEGLTIANAIGEGILVVGQPGANGAPGTPVTNVTISDNVVLYNDQGNPTGAPITSSTYTECNANPAAPLVPGDCGEGIHLMVADNSTVTGNVVTANAGGILLTDEFGPTSGNLITNNVVTYNRLDCGITLASHAFSTAGPVAATQGGVFNNTIKNNQLTGNGTEGQGAGVLLAAGAPGGAVYDNLVSGNTIVGNGLAGVTVHSHAPGQNLNGNTISGNTIGTNNLDGDPDFAPALDMAPTGIFVGSATPLTITITNNRILANTYGVFLTATVPQAGVTGNVFQGVTTPIYTAS